MATIQQPINDWQLSITPNAQTSEIVVDFVQTNTGDLGQVTGIARLMQSILMWLLTPQGQNPFDPNYGNPFYAELGRPLNQGSQQLFLDMLNACEATFLTNQSQAAQAGQLTDDEMVDHFADNQVTLNGPGVVIVNQGMAIPFASIQASGQIV
jgi:hypothetical protein